MTTRSPTTIRRIDLKPGSEYVVLMLWALFHSIPRVRICQPFYCHDDFCDVRWVGGWHGVQSNTFKKHLGIPSYGMSRNRSRTNILYATNEPSTFFLRLFLSKPSTWCRSWADFIVFMVFCVMFFQGFHMNVESDMSQCSWLGIGSSADYDNTGK